MYRTLKLFGKSIRLYGFLNKVSVFGALLVMLLTIEDYKKISTIPKITEKYYNLRRKNDIFHRLGYTLLELIPIYAAVTALYIPSGHMISLLFFGSKDSNFFANIYVTPLALFVIFALLKVSPLKGLDYMSAPISVTLAFYKLACFCQGCCYGIASPYGLYNKRNERTEIPVQLIEMGCALVIFVILLYMRKHKKLNGVMYPAFMLMFCGLRFCSEFLRADYEKVWGQLTGYHIQCLIGLVLGAVYLVLVIKFGERITLWFERRNKAFLDKMFTRYNQKYANGYNRKKKKK